MKNEYLIHTIFPQVNRVRSLLIDTILTLKSIRRLVRDIKSLDLYIVETIFGVETINIYHIIYVEHISWLLTT